MIDTAPVLSAANVRAAWDAASDADRAAGRDWYAEAHALARELDPANPARAAGVIAALSPQTPWERNVTLARQAYAAGRASGTLRRSCAAADAIMSGADPAVILTGPKVRSFWILIADPADAATVCVDRHAIDVAAGVRLSDADRSRWFRLERAGRYDVAARCYRAAARDLGERPSTVQAATWVAWRKIHAGTRS